MLPRLSKDHPSSLTAASGVKLGRMLTPLLLSALSLLACRGETEPETDPQIVSQAFSVRGSVEQVHVWSADPETDMEVVDADGTVVAQGTTDYQGSLVLRALAPDTDLVVRLAANPDELTDQIEILSIDDSIPPQSFYDDQVIEQGNGYITARDGTQLSYYMFLPGPPEEGPYPTIVNYSGYSPGKPGESLGAEAEIYCGLYPILCEAPSFPTGILAGVMGYAVVGVNMRGTGCSGGAYDYFEPLQITDGYDVIEAVSAQDWVKGNQVGMSGLSFPGITQLFVAKGTPPSLAAITPFSVIGDTMSSTLIPGGIFNVGFASEWYDNVLSRAQPYGHGWITDVVNDGDTVCEENQLLHSQMLDRIQLAKEDPFYSADLAEPVDPSAFADQIQAPVFLAGQWHDEQTGPHFATLLDKFDNSSSTHFTVTNGVHPDGLSAQNLAEWKIFLDLYVAEEVPEIPKSVELVVPLFMDAVFGAPVDLPDNRFEDYDTWQEAKDAYETEGDLLVIFESGASPDAASGAPEGTFSERFAAWPPPEAETLRWYLQPNGGLSWDVAQGDGGSSSFEHVAEAGDRVSLASGSIDGLAPNWDWRSPVEGQALSYLSPVLEEDLVLLGHGSVDLWVMTEQADMDIQVSISEVRPDGQEMLIQNGWLRASQAQLRDDATELRPVKTHYEADVQLLTPGEWTQVRVEIMPYGHVLHAGSQVRLIIDTPGGNMARWKFELLDLPDGTLNHVGHSADLSSSIVLSTLPDLAVPTDLPACPSLRGQPCREFLDIENLE